MSRGKSRFIHSYEVDSFAINSCPMPGNPGTFSPVNKRSKSIGAGEEFTLFLTITPHPVHLQVLWSPR